MKLVEVLIEYKAQSINHPFSYLYDKDDIKIGERVLVNFNNRLVVGYVIKVTNTNKTKEELEKEIGFNISNIKEVIDNAPLLNKELMELVDTLSEYYLCSKISLLQAMLPPSLKPRTSALSSAKIAYDKYVKIIDNNEDDLTPKQKELLRLISSNKQILVRDIKQKAVLDNLVKHKRVEYFYLEKLRYNLPEIKEEEYKTLTKEQEEAYNNILNTDKVVSLLHGVTGSGKTEIYLHLSRKYINEGKSVLMLVPEISLTPQTVNIFLSRFKEKIAVLHSGLTPAEKYDEYRRISKGEVKIVVGARSAIFAPLDNIGLIILDEEHVESYKQDVTPFYHAKEVAIIRAKNHNAKVVLGSATPSLESRARALKGVYNYVRLNNRANNQHLPKTTVVDILDSRNLSRESPLFSTFLVKRINEELSKHHQILLLLNRRGYSPYVYCRKCSYIFKCPDCNIPLTYHKSDNMLKCHHCEYVLDMPKECPECGSTYLGKQGFGIERVIDDASKLFKGARILRLDSDVARVKNNIKDTIEKFKNNEADILVGTQMIAKGHDFANVTLVAVLLADLGLSQPSFRSSERTFELLTQTVGRSGRGYDVGEAIIQTYSPNHYVIKLAAKQDYDTFFKQELNVRKIEDYPPFTYVTKIEVATKNEEASDKIIAKIAIDLIDKKLKDVKVIGPSRPYIPYESGLHKRTLYLKYKDNVEVKNYLKHLLDVLGNKSNIKLSIDINTYDF